MFLTSTRTGRRFPEGEDAARGEVATRQPRGLQIISSLLMSKKVWVFMGLTMMAVSAPPQLPPMRREKVGGLDATLGMTCAVRSRIWEGFLINILLRAVVG